MNRDDAMKLSYNHRVARRLPNGCLMNAASSPLFLESKKLTTEPELPMIVQE